jgi:ornithine--oxo-acid transaminase
MDIIKTEDQYGAHHYSPLPVVLVKGKDVHLWDETGKQYIDMMSAYSAVSLGYGHPAVLKALHEQADRLCVVSRGYYSDKLAPFLKRMCEITGFDKGLPMNTGAEAVETALKAARKWAYTVKGVPENKAEIISCEGNFHGRTIAIIGLSSEKAYQKNFGPYPAGNVLVPYGDPEALEAAITENTAAFLVEPIQGEAGIVVPPKGYLKRCEAICKRHNVLFICDEIQTGLGRTGRLFAHQHDEVSPDALILGKALGGGVLPVSMFLANNEVMDVFKPGDHGSTFGGNPLSSAVGLQAINTLLEEKLTENSAELGAYFKKALLEIDHPAIVEVRGSGLFIGVEINPDIANARDICLALMDQGLLSKETHATVVRFAPPLTIDKATIDQALDMIRQVFSKI